MPLVVDDSTEAIDNDIGALDDIEPLDWTLMICNSTYCYFDVNDRFIRWK